MKILILILQIIFLAILFYIVYTSLISYKLNNEFKNVDLDDMRKKKLLFVSSFIMLSFSLWICLGIKMSFLKSVVLITVLTFMPFIIDMEAHNFEQQKLGFLYADIFLIFEVCFKSGLDLDDALFICSKFVKSKNMKKNFQEAGATYKKSKDKEEAMQCLYDEIGSKEIRQLKSSVCQIDRIGFEGVKSLETLTSIAQTDKITKEIKKKDFMQYAVLLASFLLLIGIFNLLFFPMMKDINGSMDILFK